MMPPMRPLRRTSDGRTGWRESRVSRKWRGRPRPTNEVAVELKTDPRAIFIVGPARAGSTILGKLLGTASGVGYIGETAILWRSLDWGGSPGSADSQWGLHASIGCGCGSSLMKCPVWTDVLDGMVEELSLPSSESLGPYLRQLRERHYRHLPVGRANLSSIRILTSLYRHAASSLGCSVIVDSSKDSWIRGLMASVIADDAIEADVVHLVRDPCATSYSWRHPGGSDSAGVEVLARRETVNAARHWTLANLQSSLLRWRAGSQHAVLLRYEDLMGAPQRTLNLLSSALRLAEIAEVDRGQVSLTVSHTLHGNRSRFQSGLVTLEARQEWLSEPASALGTTLPVIMTQPLSWRYGYHLSGRPGRLAPLSNLKRRFAQKETL